MRALVFSLGFLFLCMFMTQPAFSIGEAKEDESDTTRDMPRTTAMGVEVLFVYGGGFGGGGFYELKLDTTLSCFASLAVSGIDDEGDEQLIGYFGQTYVPGKVNRFLRIPLLFGVKKQWFKDDIVETVRFYTSVALGPTMVYEAPFQIEHVHEGVDGVPTWYSYEQIDFFNSLGKGKAHYTLGGYLGAAIFAGNPNANNTLGLEARYYVAPVFSGIVSRIEGGKEKRKFDFGGFAIALIIGF